jgi:hypothetical protein
MHKDTSIDDNLNQINFYTYGIRVEQYSYQDSKFTYTLHQ